MDRTRPVSRDQRHPGEHRRRPRQADGGDKAGDLFLELAKDDNNDWDASSSASQAGSPEWHDQTTLTSKLTPTATNSTRSIKQYPSNLSFADSSPHLPGTTPPVSGQRYFRNYPQMTASQEYRRVSAGEANASMRPFKPSYRPSHLSALAYDSPSSSFSQTTDMTVPSPRTPSCADGIDSVGSVTAVSTIWDEAEDLKSKLKQYRANGRRIRSGGANMEDAMDRPRTSTTMTTNSSSPHPLKQVSSITADDSAKHQLLRTALQRLRGHIDDNTYRTLETSIADVIAASSILDIADTASTADDRSVITTHKSASDRRLRHKIDNLCRSMTELCIALSNTNDHTATLVQTPSIDRPMSNGSATRRHNNNSPTSYLDERRARQERLGSSSRAPSRISEGRESSIHASETARPTLTARQSQSNTRSRRLSITDEARQHLSPPPLSRAATSTDAGSNATSSSHNLTIRAPSRAATEAPTSTYNSTHDSPVQLSSQASASSFIRRHSLSRDRAHAKGSSRDYTDVHPLPDTLSISPSLRKTLATNHSNISLNSGYSAQTYAGGGGVNGVSIGERGRRLLEERLERRRREMDVAGVNGMARRPGSSGIV